MASSRRVVVLLAALTLTSAAPMAIAWGAKGVAEPDTKWDRDGGHMFLLPDQNKTERRVYFNGFQGTFFGYGPGIPSTFSPNSAALGTRHQTYPFQAWAMLGVWKDCDKDGYVGHGDQGLWEYPVQLLPADTPCIVTALPANPTKMTDWTWTPVHNDGKWVHEFLSLGYDDWAHDGGRTYDNNPWNFNDSDARVWADWGVPGGTPAKTCYVTPHPRGMYHTTGNMTNYADCFASGRVDSAGRSAGPAWTTLMGVKNPWGEESDASYVEFWSCAGAPVATTRDPTYDGQKGTTRGVVEHPEPGGDGRTYYNFSNSDYYLLGYNNVSQVGSPAPNAGGSPAGTVNSTESGTDKCHRRSDGTYTNANLAYALESDRDNDGARKVETDQTLRYIEGRRTGAPWAGLTNRGAPPDLGVNPTGLEGCQVEGSCNQGFWRGTSVTAASRNPFVNRDTLATMPVTYLTYYANVGSAAIEKWGLVLPGAGGRYGSESCSIGAPTWECDPLAWWPNDTRPREDQGVRFDPAAPTRGLPIGALVNDPFRLRDVDCFDESVNGAREEDLTFYALTSGSRCG